MHGSAVATHLVAVAAVVGAHGTTTGLATLTVAATGMLLTTHGARLLLHKVGHGLEQHLQVVLDLFLVGKIGPLGTLRVLLAEELEVMLVLGGFGLDLTDFLDLV
ncbi:MAG: hypothetical protein GY849_17120, partial [Deltaproteobacteria bacterium]|nr:hypothetical protein [Deltaproteobacteria bacterium]